MTTTAAPTAELEIAVPPLAEAERILTPEALSFVARLARRFTGRIDDLLEARERRRARWAEGESLGFHPETALLRAASWRVAPPPADLAARGVEMTGPADRNTIVEGLNSGADVFMADLEDSMAPTWRNIVEAQVHLYDAVRRRITRFDSGSVRIDRLKAKTATLMVRPRGLHLLERGMTVNEEPVPASLFDFGLFVFHNAAELVARGSGPYFTLPKIESYLEARLWNDIFVEAQRWLGIPRGTIRAAVLIETLPAAFEMDEILSELREHSAGLTCGHWDYIFSVIKTRRHDRNALLPDRAGITTDQPFLRALSRLLVRSCHRRGAPAIGPLSVHGSAAATAARDATLEDLTAEKGREAAGGFDGSRVAHTDHVAAVRGLFRSARPEPFEPPPGGEFPDPVELLEIPRGPRTEEGLRLNIRVGVRYITSWLEGTGRVPFRDRMEETATAEISRSLVWQWVRHAATLDDGRVVTPALLSTLVDEETAALSTGGGSPAPAGSRLREAAALFRRLSTNAELEEFLTLPAYRLLEGTTP